MVSYVCITLVTALDEVHREPHNLHNKHGQRTYIYIYIYTYMSIYIYIYIYMYIYICIYTYTYIYIYMCLFIYLFNYLFIYLSIFGDLFPGYAAAKQGAPFRIYTSISGKHSAWWLEGVCIWWCPAMIFEPSKSIVQKTTHKKDASLTHSQADRSSSQSRTQHALEESAMRKARKPDQLRSPWLPSLYLHLPHACSRLPRRKWFR